MLQEVPLDTLHETSKLSPSAQTIRRDNPAMIVMTKDDFDLYPNDSEIEQIKNHIYAMDRRKVMFDTQFLRHTEAITLFT